MAKTIYLSDKELDLLSDLLMNDVYLREEGDSEKFKDKEKIIQKILK